MIKRSIFSIFIACFCLLASPLSVQAKDILGSAAQCNNPSAGTGSSAICTDDGNTNANDDPVIDKLQNITKIIAFVAGAAAVLIMMVGGINYITSAGDSGKISSARDTIIYALVGLAIVVLSATIIEFVLNQYK